MVVDYIFETEMVNRVLTGKLVLTDTLYTLYTGEITSQCGDSFTINIGLYNQQSYNNTLPSISNSFLVGVFYNEQKKLPNQFIYGYQEKGNEKILGAYVHENNPPQKYGMTQFDLSKLFFGQINALFAADGFNFRYLANFGRAETIDIKLTKE